MEEYDYHIGARLIILICLFAFFFYFFYSNSAIFGGGIVSNLESAGLMLLVFAIIVFADILFYLFIWVAIEFVILAIVLFGLNFVFYYFHIYVISKFVSYLFSNGYFIIYLVFGLFILNFLIIIVGIDNLKEAGEGIADAFENLYRWFHNRRFRRQRKKHKEDNRWEHKENWENLFENLKDDPDSYEVWEMFFGALFGQGGAEQFADMNEEEQEQAFRNMFGIHWQTLWEHYKKTYKQKKAQGTTTQKREYAKKTEMEALGISVEELKHLINQEQVNYNNAKTDKARAKASEEIRHYQDLLLKKRGRGGRNE